MAAHDHTFVAFVTASRRELRRTAYLLCRDWDLAEDVTQDALVKLYGAWARIDRRESALAYARRIVVNAAIDQGRRPWRREVPAAEPRGRVVSHPSDTVDLRLVLLATLGTLPPRRRACVVLRYFNDLSVADTARTLGCSEGTVKSQTARGLEDIRARLTAHGLDAVAALEGMPA